MTKDEVYSKLLERVQREGGYLAIPTRSRLIVKTVENKKLTVAAVVECADDSSPLKFIAGNFHSYDLYDYLGADELEHLLSIV